LLATKQYNKKYKGASKCNKNLPNLVANDEEMFGLVMCNERKNIQRSDAAFLMKREIGHVGIH